MKQKLLKIYYKILAKLAKGYIKKRKPYIIGINGSVGKTSCRFIIAQTLNKYFDGKLKVSTSKENFNGELGFSLSIFEINEISPSVFSFLKTLLIAFKKRFICPKKHYDIVILEYGIDTPGEMNFMLDIAKPDIGVFTKIDAVHSEQFGNPQAIANEESLMVKSTKDVAFLNSDDTYARQLYSMIEIDKFLYTTTKNESDQLLVSPHIDYSDEKLSKDEKFIVSSELNIKNNDKIRKISTNLIGKENYGYISLAFAILDILKYKFELKGKMFPKIYEKTSDLIKIKYKLIPGRSSIFKGINESIIFDSSYNAAPLSMRKLIETTNTLKFEIFTEYKICLVIGDMRELGDWTQEEHRKIAGVASMVGDEIILVGKSTNKRTKDELGKIGFNGPIHCFQNSQKVGQFLQKKCKSDKNKWLILFKGSQNTIFLEEAIKYLLDPKENNIRHYHYLTRQSKWRMEKKEKFFKILKK